MRQTTVTLGGREYTVTQKPMGATARWREKLRNGRVLLIFQSLDHVITQFNSIATDIEAGGLANVDAGQAFSLARILPIVTDGLSNSVDEVWGLVFEYASNIEADREWLAENAFDEEGIDAFLVILGFCFPISALWAKASGRKVPATNTNSPSRNGVSGLPASGPRKKNVKTSS